MKTEQYGLATGKEDKHVLYLADSLSSGMEWK